MPPDGFPTFRLRIGFPSNPDERLFILDVSLLDGGDVLAGEGDGFEDVTEWLNGDEQWPIKITRGRSSPRSDWPSGKATIKLRNTDGRFDPLNLEGPYVLNDVTLVECGRRVWITAELADGTVEDRFYGQVEAYTPGLDERGWPTMELTCAGPFSYLAAFDPGAVAPVGEGEDSGARWHRILDNANVPDGDRDIATGDSTLQPTTLAQNALTECRLVAASEYGAFYENRHGRFQGDNRRAVLEVARMASPRATFGPQDAVNIAAGILPYTSITPTKDKDRLINDSALARTGGAIQSAEDVESKAKFFAYTRRRTDLLLEEDAGVAQQGEWDLLLYGDAEYRYDSIEISVLSAPDEQFTDMVAFMIEAELRDRIAVLEQIRYFETDDDDVGWVRENTEEAFIERIEERISWKAWEMDLSLASAQKFTNLFILDVSLLDGDDVLAPL